MWLPLAGQDKAQTSTQHQQSKQQSMAKLAKHAKQSKAEQSVVAFGRKWQSPNQFTAPAEQAAKHPKAGQKQAKYYKVEQSVVAFGRKW